MNAKQVYAHQVKADIILHKERLKWLKSDNLKWACGTPVSKSDRNLFIKQSELILENPCRGYNSAEINEI